MLSLPFALRYLLATRPEVVTHVLGIVYRAISAHLIRKAGLTRASAATGAVTVIQRFGSALNLNVHVHRARPCARQRALAWAPPLKRVFAIDIYKSAGLPLCTTGGRREAVGHRDVSDEICLQFGGRLRVIASIEVPAVIDRILAHLGHEAAAVDPAHPSRAPPRQDRLI